MNISIEKLGKRFNRDWIFRKLDYSIEQGTRLAITGSNGSGKSTLLKIIGSYGLQTEGQIRYYQGKQDIKPDEVQLNMNFAAPYFNLIDEFTLSEFLDFHANFKNVSTHLEETIEKAGLAKAINKPIKDFSSGMKQRVKLITAFGYEADVILLDEPTSNLDKKGIMWFEQMVHDAKPEKTIIIASNIDQEISLCEKVLSIEKF